jgi:hypothetical protein
LCLQCIKVIYAYMGFAVFNIFFFITGTIIIQLLVVAKIHIDIFSLAFILFNFSVGGTFLPAQRSGRLVHWGAAAAALRRGPSCWLEGAAGWGVLLAGGAAVGCCCGEVPGWR